MYLIRKIQTNFAQNLFFLYFFCAEALGKESDYTRIVISESHNLCFIVKTGYRIRLKQVKTFVRFNINYYIQKDLCKIHFSTVQQINWI